MPLSEVFLTGLYIAGFGFMGGVLAVCYKSKCSKVSCCGFEIVRDVAGEEKLDEIEIENKHTTRQPSYGAEPITEQRIRRDSLNTEP